MKETYLINKLLSSDFKQILRKVKSWRIIRASAASKNFNRTEFDIVYKTASNATKIPGNTEIYRLDLPFILSRLQIDDLNDEAMFYEFNQLDSSMFRLNRLTGLITLATDWYPTLHDKSEHKLRFNLAKSLFSQFQFVLYFSIILII